MFYDTRIKFETHANAKNYLEELIADATYSEDGYVTVADVLEDHDIHTCNSDKKFGWTPTMLKIAHIIVFPAYYAIEFPDPFPVHMIERVKNPESPKEPSRDTLNITVNTNELKDPDAALAGIFKMIPYIKDRVINISIF